LAAVISGSMIVCWWNFGDWMPGWRLLVPATPFLLLLAQEGLRDIAERTQLAKLLPVALGTVVLGTILNAGGGENHGVAHWVDEFEPLGRSLARVGMPGDILATGIAGSIPYYSGLYTIDTLGLNDKHIAATGVPIRRWGRENWSYVLGRQPTFWHVTSREAQLLSEMPDFAVNYVFIEFLATNPLQPCQYLYVRKNTPAQERVARIFDVRFIEPDVAVNLVCKPRR